MTVADLFQISRLEATLEDLFATMAVCPCRWVVDAHDLCPHCESLASIVGAIFDTIPRLWQDRQEDTP